MDALLPYFAEDFKPHSGAGIDSFHILAEGQEKWSRDRRTTIEDIFAGGDRVAVRVRIVGTNSGGIPLWGVPGNDLEYDIQWISIYRVTEGKIVEHWGVTDALSLAYQLGAWNPKALQNES